MINHSDVFQIGKINKPHGLAGEVSFSFTTDVFDTEEAPYVVMEMDGILVPFFIEEYRFRSDSTALLKLEGIDSESKAKQFTGLTVYLPVSYLENVEPTGIDMEYFIGFTMEDVAKSFEAEITDVDQTTDNLLFVARSGDNEWLIPASDDFIRHIDHDKKIIEVELPEGLLDL